jgi:hypothetical protein
MRHSILVFAIALLPIIPAQAQDTVVSKGSVDRSAAFAQMLGAIMATPASIEFLKSRAAISPGAVTLINAADLSAGQSDTVLNLHLQRHAALTEQLRATLSTRPELTALLAKYTPKLAAADVIAVDTRTQGVTIYYRKEDHSAGIAEASSNTVSGRTGTSLRGCESRSLAS